MNHKTILFITLFILFTNDALAAKNSAPEHIDVLPWLRMPADKFGCYMEESLGYKDKKFNCSLKNYTNKGDSCKDVEANYEGPEFPAALARRIHPKVKSVSLDWEYGKLRAVTIHFNKGVTESEIKNDLKLPKTWNYPENIMDISVGNCNDACLSITGFDHMGAADLECP